MRLGFAVVVSLALAGAGCGSRCKEVTRARTALDAHAGAPGRGADVRVSVPLARANAVFADALRVQPLTVALALPDLGPLQLVTPAVSATVREVRLEAGAPGKVRFATVIEVRDDMAELATLRTVIEVEPKLERDAQGAQLSMGFGPENVVAMKPELGPRTQDSLNAAVDRWLPEKLKTKVPSSLRELASARLGAHLAGAGYEALQRTLLVRLGELTRLRLRLPDVPVHEARVRSTPSLLVVEIVTDLPVRVGLAPAIDDATEVDVELAGSAVAELANWAIDHGHAPRWYTRSLTPSPAGEFRPRFDYVAAEHAHPFKVYAFQERGGCSYFRVGVRGKLAIQGTDLVATVTDRALEASAANPVIEAAAWVKYFFTGAIDRSKRVAAHTRLTIGARALDTQVITAALASDAVRFGLRFDAVAPPVARR